MQASKGAENKISLGFSNLSSIARVQLKKMEYPNIWLGSHDTGI